LNATQAAIRAGYSPKRADEIGYENLKKPEIQTALADAMQKRSERTEITVDYVLTSLKSIADRCLVQGDGFNPRGANKALELLGKHLRLFVERQELTGKGGGPVHFQIEDVNSAKELLASRILRLIDRGTA
jgi:phage terminase small subunit